MDADLAIVFIFTIILLVLLGGFIVLFPLTRRLGHFVEVWLSERKRQPPAAGEIAALRQRLEAVESELGALAERQEFVEKMIEKRAPAEALPKGE